jgi:hypothetical protein
MIISFFLLIKVKSSEHFSEKCTGFIETALEQKTPKFFLCICILESENIDSVLLSKCLLSFHKSINIKSLSIPLYINGSYVIYPEC